MPINFFPCSKTQSKLVTRWKILLVNFSFKNQNKEKAFGAAMMIFPLRNKIANMQIIYKPTTEKPGRMNQISSQLYTFSCLYLLEKKCTRLKSCHLIPHATICMLWETTEKTWLRSFALIVAVKHCSRFVITGKSVLYFKSSRKVKK